MNPVAGMIVSILILIAALYFIYRLWSLASVEEDDREDWELGPVAPLTQAEREGLWMNYER